MKVVILDDWEKCFLNHPDINQLKAYFDVEIYHDHPSKEELMYRVANADIIIPIRERTIFSKDILQQMKKIKLISQTGGGLAHIDMDEAKRLRIPITTTPGGSAAVVELIFGFMLAYSRQILSLHQEMVNGKWTESVGFGLEGKSVGIIGLGKIGARVAKIATAFQMNVLAWGPRLTPERAKEHGVTFTTLEMLLQQSHYVVMAVRLVPETRHLLKEHHFQMMRNDSFLINTSRGDVIDEMALVHALKEKQIGGAGLDVFSQEPLPTNHPFFRLENVILTPHIGWKTDQMFHTFASVAIENILSFFINQLPRRMVNPEVLNE